MSGQDDWPAFAGIDWGGEHHQLCIVDPTGKRRTQLRVTHDVAGLADLDAELVRCGQRLPIAIERSEGLLVEHLQAAGHVLFPVSPRIAARARERYKVAAVKDDRFDAFVLADTLRHEHRHWRPLSIPSPLLAEIRALTRDRDRLLETQQAVEHQLRMILEAYHPAPVRLFSSVDRQITLSFVLDYPTPAIASRVKTTRMGGFLDRHHYTGRVSAQVLAQRMRANLLSGSPGTVAGKSFSAQSYTKLLQLLNSQLAEYDDAIAAALAEHSDTPIFASFPGVGPVTTAVLLSEIGEDRCRYPRPEVLLAEAGLAPGHPILRALTQRAVPLRRQHPAPRVGHVVGLQLHEGLTLGTATLRRLKPKSHRGIDMAYIRTHDTKQTSRGKVVKRYEVVYRVKVRERGQAVTRLCQETYTTREAAEARRDELNSHRHHAHATDPSKQRRRGARSLDDYAADWIAAQRIKVASGSLKERTLDEYAKLFYRYVSPGLGHLPIAAITPAQLEQLIADLATGARRRGGGDLNPKTVKHAWHVRSVLAGNKFASRQKLLSPAFAPLVTTQWATSCG